MAKLNRLLLLLLVVIAWQSYLIFHYQHLLRDMNAEMQKATAQMNEDVAVMNRLRKACGIQQTTYQPPTHKEN